MWRWKKSGEVEKECGKWGLSGHAQSVIFNIYLIVCCAQTCVTVEKARWYEVPCRNVRKLIFAVNSLRMGDESADY